MEHQTIPLAAQGSGTSLQRVRVWDRFVRTFHWSLVGAMAVAFATSLLLPKEWALIHVIDGTACVALVAARLVWGWLGPEYARFAAFVRGPAAVIAHMRDIAAGRVHRHRGHNPLGAAMIVALLAGVVVLGVTGTATLGGELKSGPLAFALSFTTGSTAREVHELVAYAVLGLITAHVAGAIFESRRTRENLPLSMVTGLKEARSGDEVPAAVPAHAVLAAILSVTLFAASGFAVATLMKRPALGAPVGALDASYKKECGDCHIAYHPSLLPSAQWTALMDGLARHFGENATLPAATAAPIRSYLTANAAETFDTLAANAFRRVSATDPLRITAAPFWQRTHDEISDAVFKAKPVKSKGNCVACHSDAATGMFQPWNIEIPDAVK